jgi:hypothetical protein
MNNHLRFDTVTYEEQLEHLVFEADWRSTNLYNSVFVFDIQRDDRREIFYQYVAKNGWRKFQKDLHNIGDENYDFVLLDNDVHTVLKLYNALKQHNGKILIFDNDIILTKKGLIGIIEGGICSNPDYSLHKWYVNPEGMQKFMFKGYIIVLTSFTRADCEKKEKLHYLMRDCLKI